MTVRGRGEKVGAATFTDVVSERDQRRRAGRARALSPTVEKTSAGTLVTVVSGGEKVSAARWPPSRLS